jgi:N-acylethanolamine-hydrolysing acid amidase
MARNQTGVAGPLAVLGNSSSGSGAGWFVVQTNYDHWEPDPADDPRRSAGEATMAQLGRGFGTTPLGLFVAASAYPVHNPHTAYTAVMSPLSGELRAVVREALCPVDPTLARADSRYCASAAA